MVNSLKYQKELDNLKVEHSKLEDKISDLMRNKVIDQFIIHDLKKKKLLLKEAIIDLGNTLFADNSAA